jgi:hypothetical protein
MVYVKDFSFPKEFGFHGSDNTSDTSRKGGRNDDTYVGKAKDGPANRESAKRHRYDDGGSVQPDDPFTGGPRPEGPMLNGNSTGMISPTGSNQMPARVAPHGGGRYYPLAEGGHVDRQHYDVGGSVMPAAPGPTPARGVPRPVPTQPSTPGAEPTISMPMSMAGRIAQGLVAQGQKMGAAAGSRAQGVRPMAPPMSAASMGGMAPGGAGAGGGMGALSSPMAAAPAASPRTGVPAMKEGGHLTAKQRHALPAGDFALPGERYPIEDKAHARNALARVSQNGSSAEKDEVRSKVHRKYPEIGKRKD